MGCQTFIMLVKELVPASSLTYFKLAWRTATCMALVTTKCCSDLTLLCIDNHYLFPKQHPVILLFLFLHLVEDGSTSTLSTSDFVLTLIPLLMFALYFI